MAFVVTAAVVGTGLKLYGQKKQRKAQRGQAAAETAQMQRESEMLGEQSYAEAQMNREATAYQNKYQQQQANWNANQLRQQAKDVSEVGQENVRRERENNAKELARRRASAARGGLMETGAVADGIIEAADRHQTELDDIWGRAADFEHQLLGQAAMTMWEAAVGIKGRNMQTKASNKALMMRTSDARWQTAANISNVNRNLKNSQSAGMIDMWSTAIGGAGSIYKGGVKTGLWGQPKTKGIDVSNASQGYTIDGTY
jgi:hypothetical protein